MFIKELRVVNLDVLFLFIGIGHFGAQNRILREMSVKKELIHLSPLLPVPGHPGPVRKLGETGRKTSSEYRQGRTTGVRFLCCTEI